MSIYKRVQDLIKKQGITVRELERECELANATIRRWETQTPNIESVRKVAQKLNVTIDYLVTGSSPNTNISRFEVYCDGNPLTEAEADLVAMYRLIDPKGQEDIFDFITMKYEKATGKRGSIYSTYLDENVEEKNDLDRPQNNCDEIA